MTAADRSLTANVFAKQAGSPELHTEAEHLLLAAVVACSHDAILTKTMDGTITSWNAGAERLYGYTAAEAIGQPVTLIIPPEQPDEFPAIMARLARGERVEHFETVRRHKDGHHIDVSLTVSPLISADGAILGASAVARDIGERKRLEAERRRQDAALRASEEKYRSLFGSISQGFCILEVLWTAGGEASDLRYLEVNPAFEQQTGLRHATGKTARDLYGGLEPSWLATVAGVARTGEPVRYQDYVAALDRWFDVYFFRLPEPNEDRIAAIFTDVTARMRREAEREAFIAAMTHDLKSPLATIQGTAQLLARRAQRAESVASGQLNPGLATIQTATGRMAAMLNELLDVARIQQGRALDLQLADCDLVALCREVLAEQQALTTRHTLQLDCELTTVVGRWDRARLERVLRNLVGNAVKYSPAGGAVRMAVQEDSRTAEVVLSVTDEGLGIPAADLPELFRAFRRGRNVTDQIPGSGIGLVSVQQVVEQHGGSVSATSVEGKGSSFVVRLPLVASAAPA
ncbi:MAG TPA: PAS domain S-box protein [Dehalococcoidia bacterium]|nr:PAS domain S-box protein [Dehalococcoidia bacterium]